MRLVDVKTKTEWANIVAKWASSPDITLPFMPYCAKTTGLSKRYVMNLMATLNNGDLPVKTLTAQKREGANYDDVYAETMEALNRRRPASDIELRSALDQFLSKNGFDSSMPVTIAQDGKTVDINPLHMNPLRVPCADFGEWKKDKKGYTFTPSASFDYDSMALAFSTASLFKIGSDVGHYSLPDTAGEGGVGYVNTFTDRLMEWVDVHGVDLHEVQQNEAGFMAYLTGMFASLTSGRICRITGAFDWELDDGEVIAPFENEKIVRGFVRLFKSLLKPSVEEGGEIQ